MEDEWERLERPFIDSIRRSSIMKIPIRILTWLQISSAVLKSSLSRAAWALVVSSKVRCSAKWPAVLLATGSEPDASFGLFDMMRNFLKLRLVEKLGEDWISRGKKVEIELVVGWKNSKTKVKVLLEKVRAHPSSASFCDFYLSNHYQRWLRRVSTTKSQHEVNRNCIHCRIVRVRSCD